jgi:hypothetical protein
MWEHAAASPPHARLEKRKLRLRQVAEVLADRGLEPIDAICDVLPELDAGMRVKTLLSLAEFVHPKLGRVEVTGQDGGPMEHSIKVTFG